VGRGGRLAVAGRRAAPLEAAADTDESSGFALGLRATASYATGVRFRPEIPFGAARLLADFEPWKNLLLLQNRLFDQGSPRFQIEIFADSTPLTRILCTPKHLEYCLLAALV
jgi:hypothetical protein